MAQLRLALAQVNPVLGDLAGNARMIRDRVAEAAAAGAHLVAFPEMVLTAYPVEDLALRESFVEASRRALVRLAADLATDGYADLPVVVGYLDRADENALDGDPGRTLPQNCAAVIHGGRVVGRYAKHHLPNYGVFDEYRIFAPGESLTVVRIRGVDVAIAICEDLWQEGGPVAQTRDAGAELLLVINGSPYEREKDDTRLELVRRRAAQAGCTLAYLNMVGGQDELVFDGDSMVVGTDGVVLARGPQFVESLVVVDLQMTPSTVDDAALPEGVVHVVVSSEPADRYAPVDPPMYPRLDPVEEVWRAVGLGLRDYVRKNGFRKVLLGVSGGIDSTVVATIAADVLGGENVVAISNPSKYSSDGSKDDAAELAKNLGLDYRVVPIQPMVDPFLASLGLTGVAEENLQARVRGVIWMGISNQEGPLVLANSNKSEVSVGYSTIYGDSVGGFAPIKDVPKTLVWELASWRNRYAEARGEPPPIPEATITKPPSAELRPGQTDQDSLPPYEILDAILAGYVGVAHGRERLIADGFDPATVDRVIQLVDRAEWKRRQFAPGPKISPLAFGKDRRLPITSRWREEGEDRS
ncbi:MAG TPA: NAD+ synthase [Lapillicoccus sp.]|jgi:NAD+ synthase (glutamine-hydrolysing)|uniref:NAD+ synthase n=1 Tax=Lapillicoccus sp. TaxID=1909287 RepID=UPI002F93CF79